MRAKNKCHDIRRDVSPYVKAHQRAYAWAAKAVVYRHAGKIAQAKAASQKVQQWLRKIKVLEARATRGTRSNKKRLRTPRVAKTK
jgi:hypothetical protein